MKNASKIAKILAVSLAVMSSSYVFAGVLTPQFSAGLYANHLSLDSSAFGIPATERAMQIGKSAALAAANAVCEKDGLTLDQSPRGSDVVFTLKGGSSEISSTVQAEIYFNCVTR